MPTFSRCSTYSSAPEHPSVSFYGTLCQSRHKFPLQGQEEKKCGHRGNNRSSHHRSPVDLHIPKILVKTQGDRFQSGFGDQGQGQQVFRPTLQETIGCCRDKARPHDRENDITDDLEAVCTIDNRCVIETLRYRRQIPGEQVDGKGRDKGCIAKDQTEMTVDQPAACKKK